MFFKLYRKVDGALQFMGVYPTAAAAGKAIDADRTKNGADIEYQMTRVRL